MKKSTLILPLSVVALVAIVSVIALWPLIFVLQKDTATPSLNNQSMELLSSLSSNCTNGQMDGMVTNIWTENNLTLANLKNHKIKYLFVDMGDTRSNGKLQTPLRDIKEFLDVVDAFEEKTNYSFTILPYSEINTEKYNLGNSTSEFFKNYITDYSNLNAMGFDGIFIDIEPVPQKHRKTYLELIEALKNQLPSTATIAVYAGTLGNSSNEWEWNAQFYTEVSKQSDIIVLPAYDLEINTVSKYKSYVVDQIVNISSMNVTSVFLLGIPTHKSSPESVKNALDAYLQALRSTRTTHFRGVSIFSEWTMRKTDWIVFERYSKNLSNTIQCNPSIIQT